MDVPGFCTSVRTPEVFLFSPVSGAMVSLSISRTLCGRKSFITTPRIWCLRCTEAPDNTLRPMETMQRDDDDDGMSCCADAATSGRARAARPPRSLTQGGCDGLSGECTHHTQVGFLAAHSFSVISRPPPPNIQETSSSLVIPLRLRMLTGGGDHLLFGGLPVRLPLETTNSVLSSRNVHATSININPFEPADPPRFSDPAAWTMHKSMRTLSATAAEIDRCKPDAAPARAGCCGSNVSFSL
ncbi:hypothetical protein EVAR_73975_1 [Eumeta japonica]|uniref:Uncharacterized protein n=1 Tax=Eumeta variegata TaxID=151549 RepID=A0A4C1STB8_EUMVA|nr:hypothetical protein EVAR_73975_1 [Eumeta japonica]